MNMAPLRIRNVRLDCPGGASRLTAEVDGCPVWYESVDVALQARVEVMASAFLLPAMMARRDLKIEGGAVSPRWLQNARSLMATFHAWWGYAPVEIVCDSESPAAVQSGRGQRTALFFTGGVDSFYALLCRQEPIDDLVYVHGFDVGIDDAVRAADTVEHLRMIAAEAGHRLVLVRTNLRTHPRLADADWTRTHGGALASVAYALPDVRKMIISASFSTPFVVPWGSHPETDPLWSSEQLSFEHHGVERSRMAKVLAISENPLVRRHLRVCWKNRGRRSNCCKCEKCVRTMLILKALNRLQPFEAFPLRQQLFWRACSLSTILPVTFYAYREMLRVSSCWHTRLAIRTMLLRSWMRHRQRMLLRNILACGLGEVFSRISPVTRDAKRMKECKPR
ncbi:MAG: hypothetical protein WCR06_09900 [bacterium]